MTHIENEGSALLKPIFYTLRVHHGPDEATTPTLPGRNHVPRSIPAVQPSTPASRHRSEPVEARHRDGSAVLGFQGSEVVEGGDAFAEVIGDLAEANFQSLYDRIAGLSQ